jgi:hypothetical protein
VLDRSRQAVFRLGLNLPATARDATDLARCAAFLQRRRGGATAGPGAEAAGALPAVIPALPPQSLPYLTHHLRPSSSPPA